MDSKSWDSLTKSQREDLLRNIKLSSALAQLRWSSLTKSDKRKIEGIAKGKGWHEVATDVPTRKGVRKIAKRHHDVAVKKETKNLLDKAITPEAEQGKIPEIVMDAMNNPITDIGQLTKEQLRDLNKFVKSGVLIKGQGSIYPKKHTVYAKKGYDIASERKRGIEELLRGSQKEDAVREDKKEPANVPEPTGYFTLKKAQNLTRENWLKLSDEKLHKKSIQLRDYINFIEIPDEYSRKTLVKGGYYAGVIDQFVTGVVPVDMWLHQNLKHALEDLYKEQDRRKRDRELLDKPINPAPEKKEPWQMTKEEYRRTKVSDEELAYRPKLEDRARAEDSTLEQRKGVEYSSGKAKHTLGAPNTAQAVLDSLDARIRLAYKRHRRHVEKALSEGKPVPEEVLKEYPDPIEKPSRKDGANNMPMVKEQQTEEFIQANLNLDKGLEGLSGTKVGYKGSSPIKTPGEARQKTRNIASMEAELIAKDRAIFEKNKGLSINELQKKIIDLKDFADGRETSYPRAIKVIEELIRQKETLARKGLSDLAYKTFDPKHEATEDNRMKDESKREEETYEDSVIIYETGDIGEMRGLAGIDEAYILKSGEFFTEEKQKEWEAHEVEGYEESEEPHEETYLEQLEREAENTCLIKGMRYPKKECRRVFISGIGRMHSAGVMPKKEAQDFAKRYRKMGHTVRVEKVE